MSPLRLVPLGRREKWQPALLDQNHRLEDGRLVGTAEGVAHARQRSVYSAPWRENSRTWLPSLMIGSESHPMGTCRQVPGGRMAEEGRGGG